MTHPAYQDRLAGLRRALSVALSDAQHTVAFGWIENDDEREERAELAFVNLWDATRHALVEHADCDLSEILDIIANDLIVVPRLGIPIAGEVGPDGRVSWNSGVCP